MATGKVPLSVAIIAKNEGKNIGACLRSVAFADQIVVVDSGSDDDTVAIARAHGCEVYGEPWRGFGPQKQAAVNHCRHEWILVLDADERIPPETGARIREIVLTPGPAAGYSFPRKNFFRGRWVRHGGWWPDRITRLFRRGRGRLTDAPVHESVAVDGLVTPLSVCIEHRTEDRLSPLLAKIDRYSTLGAQAAFAEGRRATAWAALGRAVLVLFQDLILRGGILDGQQGVLLAATDAVNKFFKYAKLYELTQEERRDRPGPDA